MGRGRGLARKEQLRVLEKPREDKFQEEIADCVTQLAGCCPAKQNVPSSIPSQGTCLSCGFGLRARAHVRDNRSMFLSLSPSLPSPLSKSK